MYDASQTLIHILQTDVILRSCDNVEFRTYKVLLSCASHIFRDMFSLPQPPGENDVIPIDAYGSTLRNLLSFCNPGETPDVTQLEGVLKLAIKYQMYEVAKRIIKERTWGKLHLIPPIMLAAIEKKTGRDNNAYFAAIFAMLFPEENLEDVIVIELDIFTKAQLDSLLAYRRQCDAAAVEVARPPHSHYTWMSEAWTKSNWFRNDGGEHGCNRGGNIFMASVQGKWMMRYWWREYMYAASKELAKYPAGSTVQSGEIFEQALRDGAKCRLCMEDLDNKLKEFAALFAGEIDKAVSLVQLAYDPARSEVSM